MIIVGTRTLNTFLVVVAIVNAKNSKILLITRFILGRHGAVQQTNGEEVRMNDPLNLIKEMQIQS